MKTILSMALAVVLLGSSACKKDKEDQLLIRLVNTSIYQMDNVLVQTSASSSHLILSLKPGESSEFKVFRSAYPNAYLEVTVNGEKLVHQPIDYVGSSLLKSGKHSYLLDIQDFNGMPNVSLTYRNF